MSAGLAMLNYLNTHPEVYEYINKATDQIVDGLKASIKQLDLPFTIQQVGSMYSLFFTEKEVWNFEDAKTCDTAMFGRYFHHMLQAGVYLAPAQFEALFVSTAIQEKEIAAIIAANHYALEAILATSK
jgi:glutamate-1-semialdehyde 2,1-aminomutase